VCVGRRAGRGYSQWRRKQHARPQGAGRSAPGRDGRTCRAGGGASRRSTFGIRRSEYPRAPRPAPESPSYCAASCMNTHAATRQSGGGAYRWVAAWCSLAKPFSLHCRPRGSQRRHADRSLRRIALRPGSAVKCVWRALAEIEVGAFETLEPRAPETVFCTSMGLAKVETHSSFQSGA
jgi:hypothetical protein